MVTTTTTSRPAVDVDEVIETLNTLVQVCIDGERLFSYAAGDVHDNGLRTRLLATAAERGAMSRELQGMVLRMGGSPANRGTLTGVVLQGWMDLKSAAAVRETFAILQEVERGEDISRSRYQSALRSLLPPDARALLQRHCRSVCDSHDEVRALREAYREVVH